MEMEPGPEAVKPRHRFPLILTAIVATSVLAVTGVGFGYHYYTTEQVRDALVKVQEQAARDCGTTQQTVTDAQALMEDTTILEGMDPAQLKELTDLIAAAPSIPTMSPVENMGKSELETTLARVQTAHDACAQWNINAAPVLIDSKSFTRVFLETKIHDTRSPLYNYAVEVQQTRKHRAGQFADSSLEGKADTLLAEYDALNAKEALPVSAPLPDLRAEYATWRDFHAKAHTLWGEMQQSHQQWQATKDAEAQAQRAALNAQANTPASTTTSPTSTVKTSSSKSATTKQATAPAKKNTAPTKTQTNSTTGTQKTVPAPTGQNTQQDGYWVETAEDLCAHGVLGQDPVTVPCQ